jgi:spermidine synthase
MIPWKLLDTTKTPDGKSELTLFQRGEELSIRIDGAELMNSRMHASEDALAELACERIRARSGARVLIGGLGLGYTLRAALDHLGPDAEVTVAELVPAVVRWNLGPVGHLAGHPLADPRTQIAERDVAHVIAERPGAWDAILLDVDNGPDALLQEANARLYGPRGLAATWKALRPGGIFGIWSAGPDDRFTKHLRRANFHVETTIVRARGRQGGARHLLWLAVRPGKRESGLHPTGPSRGDTPSS